MNSTLTKPRRAFWEAEFLSPKDFVRHALLIVALFAIAHFCGLREHTAFLSGTSVSADTTLENSAYLGAIYLLLYFATVLLSPAMIIAAALLVGGRWLRARLAKHTT